MDYHGRIMNIECLPPARMNQHPVDPECSAYRIGHRDARHAAAEIACEAQAEIARLQEALAPLVAYPLEEFGKENSRPEQPLFGANDWRLTVGDVRKARAALAPAAEVSGG